MITNIAVLFGGQSCEHEISILSALQVMQQLAKKYHVIPIYIDKQAHMYSDARLLELATFKRGVHLASWQVMWQTKGVEVYIKPHCRWKRKQRVDFVFPIMHGLHGEDGCVQGMLEMLNVPYAGCDVLASATCMSKLRTKQLLEYLHIPTLPFYEVNHTFKDMTFCPAIIKPNRLGSSIGIQIVKEAHEWCEKVEKALLFDEQCLIEPYIENFDEINCSVMRVDGEIVLSNLELVNKSEAILSFNDKYQSKDASKQKSRILDPLLAEDVKKQVQDIAYEVYEKLQLSGVIRIDFMHIGELVYVNEINTIPGSYAFYLWDDDFLSLLEQVMRESVKEYQLKSCKMTSFASDVLFHFHGGKK